MKEKKWGFLVLLLVIALAGGYMYWTKQSPEKVEISGFIGGEKIPPCRKPDL